MPHERIETTPTDEQIRSALDIIHQNYKTFLVQAIITEVINRISSNEDFNMVFSNLKAGQLSAEQNERSADKELNQEETQQLVCNSISTIVRTATPEQKGEFLKITGEGLELISAKVDNDKLDFPNIPRYEIPLGKIKDIRESISKDRELEAYYQQAKKELIPFNKLTEVDRTFVISYLIMILRKIGGNKEIGLADRIEKIISEQDEGEQLLSNISDENISKLGKEVRGEWKLGGRYDKLIITAEGNKRLALSRLIQIIRREGSPSEKTNLRERLENLKIKIKI